ncbi:helix-turn-helix domain-containing protein [Demequina aestuarii]|uniref:helix-turn-helix domain-containing protein n=1 Tax=Demequina aestuarii TaxID=327095 RepID=UPI000785A0E8|nr:helix-turn-helix domain-containing protein [Demequina aestuarii]
MATERARLLLHPVRMRIVIALSAQQLTTRHIHELMPEVPQASLYRAIAQLASAGIVEVVSEERRGGAMERTYRLAAENVPLTAEDVESSSPEEALAAVQTLADLMVSSSSRYLAQAGDDWSQASLTVRHAALWLTDEERADLGEELLALIDRYHAKPRGPQSHLHSIQAAVMPEVGPPDVCPNGED